MNDVRTHSAIAITILLTIVWLISLRRKDASIIDLVWGLGFVVVAWTAFWLHGGGRVQGWLLPVLTTVWGLRLSVYLTWRNHGKPEDYRYQAMREKWGDAFPWVSLLTVFALQGVVMWVVSLPVQIGIQSAGRAAGGTDPSGGAASMGDGMNGWIWMGIVLWGIGLFFETIGDWQLARFKSNPDHRGRVLESGLWRFTRHPNYFGDSVVWWGLFAVSVGFSGAWWTIIGPIVMTVFLMRISGVTLLEKSLRKTKPDYAAYEKRTSPFFPWPPRSV